MIGEAGVYIARTGLTQKKIEELDVNAETDTDGRIFYGDLPNQELYPAVVINDFGTPEDCKDGIAKLIYTMTAIVYADMQWKVNDIVKELMRDMLRVRGKVLQFNVSGVRLDSIGPWIREKEKGQWSRPIDFEVYVHN